MWYKFVSPVFRFLFKKEQSLFLKRANRSFIKSESLLCLNKWKGQFSLVAIFVRAMRAIRSRCSLSKEWWEGIPNPGVSPLFVSSLIAKKAVEELSPAMMLSLANHQSAWPTFPKAFAKLITFASHVEDTLAEISFMLAVREQSDNFLLLPT